MTHQWIPWLLCRTGITWRSPYSLFPTILSFSNIWTLFKNDWPYWRFSETGNLCTVCIYSLYTILVMESQFSFKSTEYIIICQQYKKHGGRRQSDEIYSRKRENFPLSWLWFIISLEHRAHQLLFSNCLNEHFCLHGALQVNVFLFCFFFLNVAFHWSRRWSWSYSLWYIQ